MRAIVYSRVSTDAQERDGTSLDTQERACAELAQAAGWSVIETIRDAASGYTLERPGITRIRRLMTDGKVDVVIAYAVDRLSRNQNHIGVLFDEAEQCGARLEFATEKFEDTAVGRFILAARAFIGEVEREKIAERTMRGKKERARSGRIPQAFGKGCYGYVYNPGTGKREIEPLQAEVVRRMFRRYTEIRSFSKLADELNADGIPAFQGGRWYMMTVRNTLKNESYAGRLVYMRTKWVRGRSSRTGLSYRHPVERPEDEWILIEGASPRIVDDALWDRVQEILNDPERNPPRRFPRFYLLRSRIKCGICGSAMIGQAMRGAPGGTVYKYYGCRHVYDRRTGHDCTARYVPAQKLEAGIWGEIGRILSNPQTVLNEQERDRVEETKGEDIAELKKELETIRERERRVVKFFTLGDVDEDAIREQAAVIKRQRKMLEDRIGAAARTTRPSRRNVDAAELTRTCSLFAEWLQEADEKQSVLALEALQLAVVATREEATIRGLLPLHLPEFFISQHASG